MRKLTSRNNPRSISSMSYVGILSYISIFLNSMSRYMYSLLPEHCRTYKNGWSYWKGKHMGRGQCSELPSLLNKKQIGILSAYFVQLCYVLTDFFFWSHLSQAQGSQYWNEMAQGFGILYTCTINYWCRYRKLHCDLSWPHITDHDLFYLSAVLPPLKNKWYAAVPLCLSETCLYCKVVNCWPT